MRHSKSASQPATIERTEGEEHGGVAGLALGDLLELDRDVLEVALGELSIRKLFSKEQRTFFSAHAPDGLALNELSILGPIFVLKQNFEPAQLGRRAPIAERAQRPVVHRDEVDLAPERAIAGRLVPHEQRIVP